jgi:hypothetical protein
LARMVEAIPGEDGQGATKRRMRLDHGLLAALVDRWHPETDTFHLPTGEMASTLQDISYILGLPIQGEAVQAVDVPDSWRDELIQRFSIWDGVEEPPIAIGPTKSWILQFRVRILKVTIRPLYNECVP